MKMVDNKTPDEILGMKSNSNAILMHTTQLGASLVPKLIMQCNNADFWHKFVIGNVETYDRDFILKTIIDFVHPSDLIPVNFSKKKRAFFLARNCLDALLKLAACKLIIPNPLHPKTPLRVTVIANHYPAHQLKFDFKENILTVLKKRFNKQRHLNLREFHKDEDLKDFFILSQPKLMLYVIQFVVELEPATIDLRDNYIKVLNPIRLLAGCKINLIDLRNNEIAHIEELEPLREFKELSTLQLSGNPLCNEWDSYNYVCKLKEICPTLQHIDGRNLFTETNYLIVQKNFLCSLAGGDLTSQFLEHFFIVYDSEDRQKIAPLYHKNAMFSVTYRIIPEQKSCHNIQLDHYRLIDRNIKSFRGAKHEYLFKGRKMIMKEFANLPRSFHEPTGFTCDLIYYTGTHAILVVHGNFREDKRYLGFSRSFVLQCEDNAYSIVNDQLHVYNALNIQVTKCDRHPRRVEITGQPLPFKPGQYTELQKAVREITGLNYDYSQRYLEACHYDLKKTLESFVDMHLKDEIPPEAFIQIGNQGLLDQKVMNVLEPPYPNNIINKTLTKHAVVAPRTVWQTLQDDRIAAGYKAGNGANNKQNQNLETEIKYNILAAAASNSVPPNLSSHPMYYKGIKKKKKKAGKAVTPIMSTSVAPIMSISQKDVLDKMRMQKEQINKSGMNPHGTSNPQTVKPSDSSHLQNGIKIIDVIDQRLNTGSFCCNTNPIQLNKFQQKLISEAPRAQKKQRKKKSAYPGLECVTAQSKNVQEFLKEQNDLKQIRIGQRESEASSQKNTTQEPKQQTNGPTTDSAASLCTKNGVGVRLRTGRKKPNKKTRQERRERKALLAQICTLNTN